MIFIDSQDGLPKIRTVISGVTPIDVVNVYNAIALTANQAIISGWVNVEGYSKLAVSLKNDANANNEVKIRWSNDQVVFFIEEEFTAGSILVNNTQRERMSKMIDIKAKYVAIELINRDAAVGHTFTVNYQLRRT